MEEGDRTRGSGYDSHALAPLKGVKRYVPSLAGELSRRSRSVTGWSNVCQIEQADSEEEGAVARVCSKPVDLTLAKNPPHVLVFSGVL